MSDTNSPAVSSTDAVSDWAEKDRLRAALGEAIRPSNKAALFEALGAAGITTVVVTFDGSGDSGQVESIVAKTSDKVLDLPDAQIELAQARWGESEVERSMLPIHEAVEQLAYDFLEETHARWEIYDGAYGEFTFDVIARTIAVDYFARVADTDYSQHVF